MSDRKKIINDVLIAAQRYRSMATEELGEDMLEVAKELQPLSLGDDFLPVLIKMANQEEIKRYRECAPTYSKMDDLT